MRILFVSNHFPPFEVGGCEQLCRDIAASLRARGHAASVLTSVRGVSGRLPAGEPDVHRILQLAPNFESTLSPVVQFFLLRDRVAKHNRLCLQALVRQFRPDVIFIWNLEGFPRSIAVEAEQTRGIGVAYWLAGCSPAESSEFRRYWQQTPALRSRLAPVKSMLCKVALKQLETERAATKLKLRHIAVVSEYERSKGIEEGWLSDHARVIYNGVEVDQFYRPVPLQLEGDLALVQAGRVSDDKGVHTAIEAVAEFANVHGIRNVHLYIAGSGPQRYLDSLHAMTRAQGITDMVSFLGQLPRSAIPDLFSRCHVLLLPTTHQEPFARVALEAMASGLVVLGTLTGGTAELLQPEITGLTFRVGDSEDLARQIRRLLLEPGLRVRLATLGQRMVLRDYALEHMVDNVEQLLQEACETKATA